MRLAELQAAGVLADIDVRFAEAMQRLGHADERVALAAALASRAVQRGNVCLDVRRLCAAPLLDEDGMATTPLALDAAALLAALRASPLVGDGDAPTPLVLDGAGRLYLYRYFDYQRRLARAVAGRLAPHPDIDEALLGRGLDALFPLPSEQRDAAAMAVRRRLSVISGGPGTGKTTTVVRILALLAAQSPGARMLLLAPTGKAQQRLAASVAAESARLALEPEVRARIPLVASTLHRQLGFQPRTPTRFRHGAGQRLPADVLVADEASMIDLALMTKLFEAAQEGARVVLLGDKDQLASVEAGAVLADLWDAPALAPCRARLTRSYRFGAESGIAALARAIGEGDATRALEALRSDAALPYGEVRLHGPALAGFDLSDAFGFAVTRGFRAFLAAEDPAERLALLGAFRVLCVHRRGALGAEAVNQAIERHLRREGLLRGEGVHYPGRPILVTVNDPQLELFNGDVGVVSAARHATFASQRGGVREVPLGRLPPHETVFAMTVHKSQGSEMDRVALLLPAAPSPALTRELLYTAVTRARAHVDIFGHADALAQGIARRVERASGFADALERCYASTR